MSAATPKAFSEPPPVWIITKTYDHGCDRLDTHIMGAVSSEALAKTVVDRLKKGFGSTCEFDYVCLEVYDQDTDIAEKLFWA